MTRSDDYLQDNAEDEDDVDNKAEEEDDCKQEKAEDEDDKMTRLPPFQPLGEPPFRLERAGTTATSLTSCGQRIIRQFAFF